MRLRTFAIIFALLWTQVLCSQEPASSGEVLTLDGATALALRNNRLIRNSALEIKKFDDRLAATRTKRFPAFNWYTLASQRITALNFHFDRGAFGVYPGLGPIPGSDTSIKAALKPAALLIGQVTQPLSQQYQIGLGLSQLQIGREVAREQSRTQQQAIVADVRHTYYGILQAQSALESIEESIRLYRELDRVTEQYVLQQVALKSENLEVKTRLAKAEYDALTIRNPLATQKEYLNNLLGRDLQTEFRVNPIAEAEWTGMDVAEARKVALERRPEIRQARLKQRQADLDRRIKKAEYIPGLSFSFSYLSPLNYGSLIPANIASIGFQLDWEPFDWGRKRHELAEKEKTVEQAGLSVRETENQIAIDVSSKLRKLQETRQLLALARLGQETNKEKLRVVQNRYRQEASLLKDVLQAQAFLADSNNQYAQALASFWTAKADFEKALGEDAQ